MTAVTVRQLDGKKLIATARQHTVLTDRPESEGGSDSGCTSGELLLMALASCAAGSARNYCERSGVAGGVREVDAAWAPASSRDARDAIVVTVAVRAGFPPESQQQLRDAVLSGGVTSRIALGSEIDVRVVNE